MSLRALRTSRGLSREQLAAEAGVSPRTIFAVEVEGVQPQRSTQRVLALVLGCEPTDIVPTNEQRPGDDRGAARLSGRDARDATTPQ